VAVSPVPVTDAVPSITFAGRLQLTSVAGSTTAVGARAHVSNGCSAPKLADFKAHLDSVELREAFIGLWPPQVKLTMAVRTTESLGVSLAAAGINCDWTGPELGPYAAAIPVGPVPVPVYATLPLKAGIHINGTLQAGTLNVASTTVAHVAAGGDENSASLGQQGSNVWVSGVLALAGNAKLSASIGLQAGIGVAKAGNLHVEAGFGPEFDWTSGHDCELNLDLGSLSAGVSVIGHSLDPPSFTPFKLNLWRGCHAGGGGLGAGGGSPGGGSSGGGGAGGGAGGDGPGGTNPTGQRGENMPVSAGGAGACSLGAGGSVKCWGGGTGTPHEIKGISGATSVSTSDEFNTSMRGEPESCVRLNDGRVECWQDGAPHPVEGITTATAIAVARDHACALLRSGHIFCWGLNFNGDLGDGDEARSSMPKQVLGIDDATSVSVSEGNTCATRATGDAFCWGSNWSGLLGAGAPISGYSAVPVEIPGISEAIEVAVGAVNEQTHACALLRDGTVMCWGTEGPDTPQAAYGISDAVAISAGAAQSCALLATGHLTCWGWDGYGQLGSPDAVTALPPATQVSAGAEYTCATLKAGGVDCWGDNSAGELGRGTVGFAFTPVPVEGMNSAIEVSAGGGTTCARLSNGTVQCWGLGSYSGGAPNESSSPETVPGLEQITSIASGEDATCAVSTDGIVQCWGDYTGGNAGVIEGVTEARAVATTGSYYGPHTCALLATRRVACWGENNHGELGDGTTATSATPVEVTGLSDATAIAVARHSSCALEASGHVACWGTDSNGELGDGGSSDEDAPVTVVGISNAKVIAAGEEVTCAVLATGAVECWGLNLDGKIDFTGTWSYNTPQVIPGITDADTVSISDGETCASKTDGGVTCWSVGAFWQVLFAYSEGLFSTGPGFGLDLSSITTATSVTAGGDHACARLINGHVDCWGKNNSGELGDGTTADTDVPAPVIGL
jgi:alpha-tubulin suppressor-like RCC1 family protein